LNEAAQIHGAARRRSGGVAARGARAAAKVGGHRAAEWRPFVAAFNEGLKALGYFDSQNVATEYRWADGDYSRLPALAADLVRRQVAVIAAIGGVNSALAAKAETSELPIVFLTGRDPVELGFVESYNRPGGNLTGVTMLNDELVGKRLELLREVVPKAATIATLINPDNRNHPSHVKTLEAVARAGGQQVIVIGASADDDFEPAFAILVKRRADALVVNADPFLDSRQELIVRLATRHALPTMISVSPSHTQGGSRVRESRSHGFPMA
jgi:ABC-type uncharacterized transport system substrate-binding protein